MTAKSTRAKARVSSARAHGKRSVNEFYLFILNKKQKTV